MQLLILVVAFFGLVSLANFAILRHDPALDKLLNLFLVGVNIPLFLLGLLLLFIQPGIPAQIGVELPLEDFRPIGVSLLVMSLWGIVVTLPEVRRFLGRLIPLDPDSPMHTLALMCSGYLVGNALLNLALGGLDSVAETATQQSLLDILLAQLLFVLVGVAGVGFLVRRDLYKTLARLGLERPTLRQLLGGLGWVLVLVVLQGLSGAIWRAVNPEQVALLEEINVRLLGEFDTVWEWLLLAALAALGEEILFRGALQPVLGLWATALLFAVAHVQYGATPATFFILIVGLVLGLIRRRSNTTVAIYVHFSYNFVLGLLVLAEPYLEQFAAG